MATKDKPKCFGSGNIFSANNRACLDCKQKYACHIYCFDKVMPKDKKISEIFEK